MPVKKKDKEKDEALASWRRENWRKIMDANQSILENIRDSKTAQDKNKIDAAKTLARMADILSPEKVTSATVRAKAQAKADVGEQELTEAEKAKLDEIFGLKQATT